jgi:glycosyltransferase involved in cell wall biosynthesis
MKISIIGPGIMPIPPLGWGAVESLIWDYSQELDKLGHDVQIVNTNNKQEIIDQVNLFNPDFVHLQYDDFIDVLPFINCKHKAATSHFGYIEQYQNHYGYHRILRAFLDYDFYNFCLSEGIKETFISLGEKKEKLFVTPNGARVDLFRFECNTKNVLDKSIFLAKIDYRKRQHLFQNIKDIHFAGNCIEQRFNTNIKNYLGEWPKEYLYNNLTNYSNLVLLSDGEADPLVTKEALICGLGLVISEYATAGLDLSLPFIDIIPEDKINDLTYVENIIKENRLKSIKYRKEIREYGIKNFDWSNIIKNYNDLILKLIN